MATVRDLLVRILADDSELAKALKDSERNLDAVGRRAERVGRDLTLKFTAPVIAAGAVAVKFGADYGRVMTQIINLTGASEAQVNDWRRALLELGPAVGKTPTELARALLATLSAGADASEALDIVTLSAKASAVGLGETEVVAKVVTAALQAYAAQGLTAARATDILVAGVKEGAAEAPEFAGALGRVLGQAAQLGVTFEQVVAFVATFTRLGVSADEAVTSLVGTLAIVQSPTAEATKALSAMGLSVQDLRRSIVEQGLTQTLVDLVQRSRDTGTEIAAVIPNVRALAGVLGTAGVQGEQFLQVTENIANSVGTLDAAFERAARDPAFTLDQLRANVIALVVAIGEGLAPTVSELIQTMLPTLRVLRSMDAETIRAAASILLFAAAIPPLVFGIGTAYRTVATLAAGINLLRAGLIGAGAALAPGAAIAAGLALLATLLIRGRIEALRAGFALAEFRSELLSLGDAQRTELGIAKALELDRVSRDLDEAKAKVASFRADMERNTRVVGGEVFLAVEPEGLREAAAEVERLTAAQARLSAELDAVNDAQRQATEMTARSAEEQAKARAEAERLMAELSRMGQASEESGKKLREPAKILEELEQKLVIAQRLGILSEAFDANKSSVSAYESALQELAEQMDETDPRIIGVRDRLEALRATLGGADEILATMNEDLQAAAVLGQLAGESFDEQAIRVGILEQALKDLVEAGLTPTDPAVRDVVSRLTAARAELTATAEASEELSDALSVVASVIAETQSPADKFVATMQAADLAVVSGKISMEEYAQVLLGARAAFDEATAAGEDWESQLAVGIVSAATQVRLSVSGMAESILKDISRIIARLLVMKGIMLLLGAFGVGAGTGGFFGALFRTVAAPFGGGRQHGGSVSAGTVYEINEGGTREFFRPNVGGQVIPLGRFAPAGLVPAPGGATPVSSRVPPAPSASGEGAVARIDLSNLPPARDPLSMARDGQWLRALRLSVAQLEANGWKPGQ